MITNHLLRGGGISKLRSVVAGKSLFPMCVVGLLLTHGTVHAQGVVEDADFPRLRGTKTTSGRDAVRELGAALPVVARAYGWSDLQLKETLHKDHSLKLNKDGRLFYSCFENETPARDPDGEAAIAPEAGPFPSDQTFTLHSRPGANRTIYLDFTGHVTTNTQWNSGTNSTIITPVYDFDNDTNSFSASELDRIQYIWQRVSEDYAPFEVDVTTEEPDIEALKRSNSNDQVYGVRVAIGGHWQQWYGTSAGGVAYLRSFNWSSDTPCFVFTQNPDGFKYPEKTVAEICSHEAGHTLGLSHDGTAADAYYGGHGTWAPIMGNSYSREVSHWSKGEYPGANNTQLDLDVMQTYGMVYRADDHGNVRTSATLIPTLSTSSTNGLIERNTDVDYFKFSTGMGNVNIQVAPAVRGPNLDVLLSVYDSKGTLIIATNGVTLGANLTRVLPTGLYYAAVQGTGTGDLTNGYSNYGSIGQYTFTAKLFPAPPIILTQPVDRNIYVGGTATFSVSTYGDVTSYQWRKGGVAISGATTNSLTITNASLGDGGNYTVSLVNSVGTTVSSNAVLSVAPLPTLAASLDWTNTTWTTGGDSSWDGQVTDMRDGIDAAKAGIIGDSGQCWMGTTVQGPGTLTFWWKVSSEQNNDILSFSANGNVLGSISGILSWHQRSFTIPAGTQTLRWTYNKNASGAGGSDSAWVDEVVYVKAPVQAFAFAGTEDLGDGVFRFNLSGETNRFYTIQVSTNLLSWEDVSTFLPETANFSFTATNSIVDPHRFYRVKTE